MMSESDIISIIALSVSIMSGLISLYTYSKSVRRKKIVDTIEAYRTLQTDVLDKFVSYPKSEVWNLLRNIDELEFKIAYDDCKAMIAKIEHFSVGINNKIYDFDTMDKLGGIHLIYLFDKVEPVIKHTRKNQEKYEKPYYCEFETMIEKIKKIHPEYTKKNNNKEGYYV